MKAATRKLRPPTKRHGGKYYLASKIVALMPPHNVYVEPFLGGGSVLLNKPESPFEVAGDLDFDLIHLWTVIRDNARVLAEFMAETPYNAGSFEAATRLSPEDDPSPTVWALRTLIVNRFSRGGLGKTFAWSDRLRGGQPGDANAWETIRRSLPRIAARVMLVEFANVPAATLIDRHDAPDALIYCDPPYLHETRTARKAYAHEMTRAAHEELLARVLACEATVMVSGYRSPLYDDALAGWRRHDFSMPNHSGQGRTKQRRTECLWINREG